jgi:hypothetical protein
LEYRLALGLFVRGIARDEILHIHPATQPQAAQDDWLIVSTYNLTAADFQKTGCRHLAMTSRIV